MATGGKIMIGTVSRHPENKDVELSLKYGTFVPNFGLMRTVSGTTLNVGSDSFLLLIRKIYIGGKWRDVPPCKNWIHEDCVVSRTYVDPVQRQSSLAL
jgi:hypothetical protein